MTRRAYTRKTPSERHHDAAARWLKQEPEIAEQIARLNDLRRQWAEKEGRNHVTYDPGITMASVLKDGLGKQIENLESLLGVRKGKVTWL